LRARAVAASFALVAAFLWATYYLFVLAVRGTAAPSAVLFYPFLAGGATYALWAAARGEGRRLLRTFAEPASYGRVGLLLGCQTSVLAATYLTGAVDASLLSLLGDVVLTPLVVAGLYGEGRAELRRAGLLAGLALSVAGGTLAIVGGHRLASVPAVAWPVVAAAPIFVAFYFVVSARARSPAPVQVRVAQSLVAVAAASALLSPLLPGGASGLLTVPPRALALLLVNGVLSFFVAYWLYFRAIESVGLVLPPMMMTGIPVFTLLLSAAVLGLVPAPLALLGVPVAAVGGLLALGAGSTAGEPSLPVG
jgi:drug/metabolite transporter (DMT)-like permease